MRKPLPIIVLLFFNIIAVAMAGSPQQKWVKDLTAKLQENGSVLIYWDCGCSASNCDGAGAVYVTATKEQISAAPPWNTNSLLPPLSLEKALTITLEELRQKNPDFSFRLSLAEMYAPGGRVGADKWLYALNYHGTSQAFHDRFFTAYVLMDGTILKPSIIEPKTWSKDKIPNLSTVEIGKNPAENEPIQKEIEKRLEAIVIPELDFRQANILDIIDFYDKAVTDYGTGAEKKEKSRLRIRLHESVINHSYPPYSLPIAAPILAFAGKEMSLLEALKISTNLARLALHYEGNVVTLYDPKK